MLWLNEMVLKGCVVVNGSFDSKIQFRGRQSREEAPLNHDAEVQRIFIGRNACSSERLGENRYEGGIEFDGYHVKGSIEITDGKLDELIIRDMDFGSLMVDHCRIAGNMSADRIAVSCPERGITVRSCDIEGHLQIGGRSLDCKLVLERTWVGQTWRLELEDPEDGVPKVSLIRFSAGSAVFEPVRLVYGRQQRFHFLRPPDLGMLEGAENRLPRDRRERHQLAEAYTSCKNWLATSGHLREEDHAFFYMRDAREASAWRRFAFGVAFGWGIYLRNIVISALLVVSLFAVAYVSFGLSLGEAAMLSAQSFVASIFGDWPPFSPTGPVSVLATTESLVGILYITVIIGAYIRKLLR